MGPPDRETNGFTGERGRTMWTTIAMIGVVTALVCGFSTIDIPFRVPLFLAGIVVMTVGFLEPNGEKIRRLAHKLSHRDPKNSPPLGE